MSVHSDRDSVLLIRPRLRCARYFVMSCAGHVLASPFTAWAPPVIEEEEEEEEERVVYSIGACSVHEPVFCLASCEIS